MSESTPTTDADLPTFISNILKPGSALHPTFLLVVDGVLAFLLVVLLVLLWLSAWNIHIFALIAIELALWGSIKWFLNELKNVQAQQLAKTGRESTEKKGQ